MAAAHKEEEHPMFCKPVRLLAAAFFLSTSGLAAAQAYPVKPVRLVSPLAAGGGSDAISRFIAKYLTEELRQQVVVENRPGAGGIVGGEYVARSVPDGYTLITSGSGLIIATLNYPGRIDLLKAFTPVGVVGEYSSLFAVHPSLPARTVKELIRLAKAQPGKINYGSAGNGSAGHLMMEYFQQMADIDIVQVPYKGAGPALIELMAGQVTMVFSNPLGSMPHIKSGRLYPVAVSGPRRARALPDVPTIAESGLPGFNVTLFIGLLAPAGVPPDVLGVLNAALVKVVQRREVQDALETQGMEAVGGTPEEYRERIRTDQGMFDKVWRAAKARGN